MKYARLPESLLYDPSLSDRAVRVYAVLDRYAGSKGVAWPSRETLAEHLACSPTSIDRALAELVGAGWVSKRRRRNVTSLYTLRRQ